MTGRTQTPEREGVVKSPDQKEAENGGGLSRTKTAYSKRVLTPV